MYCEISQKVSITCRPTYHRGYSSERNSPHNRCTGTNIRETKLLLQKLFVKSSNALVELRSHLFASRIAGMRNLYHESTHVETTCKLKITSQKKHFAPNVYVALLKYVNIFSYCDTTFMMTSSGLFFCEYGLAKVTLLCLMKGMSRIQEWIM